MVGFEREIEKVAALERRTNAVEDKLKSDFGNLEDTVQQQFARDHRRSEESIRALRRRIEEVAVLANEAPDQKRVLEHFEEVAQKLSHRITMMEEKREAESGMLPAVAHEAQHALRDEMSATARRMREEIEKLRRDLVEMIERKRMFWKHTGKLRQLHFVYFFMFVVTCWDRLIAEA